MGSRRSIWLAVFAAFAVLGSSCSSNGTSSQASTSPTVQGDIGVTLSDYAIALSSAASSRGKVTFDVSNAAGQEHEFVVFRTDLAPESLPTSKDGAVEEEGEGVTHVDEIPGLQAGASGTLSLDLAPGKYVFICNLPGHYGFGMHVAFAIS